LKKIHDDGINAIDFSPTGKYIATGAGYIGNGASDNTVSVWKNPFFQEEPGERKGKLGKEPPGSVESDEAKSKASGPPGKRPPRGRGGP
jgi:WD40 repeat protein